MLDFDTLYRDYAPRVHRLVLGLSGNAAVAEDITAETRVRVWATRDRVRHDTVRSFLFTIARNLWSQGVRSQWRHRELGVEDVDAAPSPEARTATRIALDRTFAAQAALRPHAANADRILPGIPGVTLGRFREPAAATGEPVTAGRFEGRHDIVISSPSDTCGRSRRR